MLETRASVGGPASSVVVVIAPGTAAYTPDLDRQVADARDRSIRVATVTYPMLKRPRPLDWMAEKTGGVAFAVTENRYNMAVSYLSTYFKLTNVMRNIMETYYQGSKSDLPVEIHRRELTDDGRTAVTGSFVLEDHMGEPAKFAVYTHNTENPLIRTISLTSPSQRVYSTRSDALLSLKMLTVPAVINEVCCARGVFFAAKRRIVHVVRRRFADRNVDVPHRTVPGKPATALRASDGAAVLETLADRPGQGLDERHDQPVGRLRGGETRRVSGARRQGGSVRGPAGLERFERAPREIRSVGHGQRR